MCGLGAARLAVDNNDALCRVVFGLDGPGRFEILLHEDYFAGIDVMGEVFACASSNGRLVR